MVNTELTVGGDTVHTLWIIAAQLIYCFVYGQCTFFTRRKCVSEKVLSEKYGPELRKAGIKLPMMGYPDQGSGRFAAVLSYKNWYE